MANQQRRRSDHASRDDWSAWLRVGLAVATVVTMGIGGLLWTVDRLEPTRSRWTAGDQLLFGERLESAIRESLRDAGFDGADDFEVPSAARVVSDRLAVEGSGAD